MTGGTQGIGLACARALVRARGWRVVITGTDRARTMAIARRIGATAVTLDLADVTGAADVEMTLWNNGVRSLEAVVCNAGVQLYRWETTEDGVEQTLAVNYLGHMALIRALVNGPLRPKRITLVSSGVHDPGAWSGMASPLLRPIEQLAFQRPKDLDEREGAQQSYATSKLCLVMAGYELARQWAPLGVSVNTFDPGLVPGTGAACGADRLTKVAWHTVYRLLVVLPTVHTPAGAGKALARLATDPKDSNLTGAYVRGSRVARSSAPSLNLTVQHEVVAQSFDLIDALRDIRASLEINDLPESNGSGPT